MHPLLLWGRCFCVAPCPSVPRIVPLLHFLYTKTGWIHTDNLKITRRFLHFLLLPYLHCYRKTRLCLKQCSRSATKASKCDEILLRIFNLSVCACPVFFCLYVTKGQSWAQRDNLRYKRRVPTSCKFCIISSNVL